MDTIKQAIERVATAVSDIKAGKMVILCDDEQRENEGDLVFAAATVTPEKINFMAQKARGLICLSLPPAKVEELGLKMMEQDGQIKNPRGTAFTISVDARYGISTGISASDRAKTIATVCSATAKPADLVVPGHVFPLRAKAGGLLEREGHTEGASDLVRIADMSPGAVICEIMKDDGTMARLPDLQVFAREHGLSIVHTKDISLWRLLKESLLIADNISSDLRTGNFAVTSYSFIRNDGGGRYFAFASGLPFDGQTVAVEIMEHVSHTEISEEDFHYATGIVVRETPAIFAFYFPADGTSLQDCSNSDCASAAQMCRGIGARDVYFINGDRRTLRKFAPLVTEMVPLTEAKISQHLSSQIQSQHRDTPLC